MRNRIVSVLFVGLLVSAILAGCSGSANNDGNTGNSGDEGSANNEVINLNFWGAVPEDSGPAQVVENWNKANPDIQVTYNRYVNDDAGNTKMETALLASGIVDVFISYRMPSVPKRIMAGMVEPLDAYIEKDKFDIAANFGNNAIVKIKDQTYYIPAIILNDFVTINKSYLDEAGLPIPTDWTWADYIDYAQKMSKGEGASKVWGSVIGNNPNIEVWMDKYVKVALGKDALYKEDGTSNFDNPAYKHYLDTRVELENVLKVQPNFSEAKATKLDGNQTFLNGNTAMFWQGTAAIRNIKDLENYPHDFVTAFAPVPKIGKDDPYFTAGTGYLDFASISANSKHKDAAWKFLKWYVTEGNEPMIPFGRVPAWKKVDPDKVVEMVLGENPEKLFDVASFKQVLFLGEEFIVDTKFDKISEMQKVADEEGQRALLGEQTTEEAVANMKKRSDALLQQ